MAKESQAKLVPLEINDIFAHAQGYTHRVVKTGGYVRVLTPKEIFDGLREMRAMPRPR